VSAHETFSREQTIKGSSDRVFGLVFTAFFALVSLLPLWSGRPMRAWALLLSAAFLIVALARPVLLAPLNAVWTRLGLLLHRITNPIVLGALFYLVFTPFALLMRLFGRDALRLRPDPRAATYWIPRQPPGPPPDTMSNQF
jgi:hypothetical protein